MASPFAFVTLVSSDAYLPGALAQVAALRDLHSPVDTDRDSPTVPNVCLVTPESVDVSTIKLLRKAFDLVVGVEILEDANERGLQLLGQFTSSPRLADNTPVASILQTGSNMTLPRSLLFLRSI